jgi:hypothetical protein
MWTIANQDQFMTILRKTTGDDVNEAVKHHQVKIVASAWENHFHVISEDLSLNTANAITCIMSSEEIKEKYNY